MRRPGRSAASGRSVAAGDGPAAPARRGAERRGDEHRGRRQELLGVAQQAGARARVSTSRTRTSAPPRRGGGERQRRRAARRAPPTAPCRRCPRPAAGPGSPTTRATTTTAAATRASHVVRVRGLGPARPRSHRGRAARPAARTADSVSGANTATPAASDTCRRAGQRGDHPRRLEQPAPAASSTASRRTRGRHAGHRAGRPASSPPVGVSDASAVHPTAAARSHGPAVPAVAHRGRHQPRQRGAAQDERPLPQRQPLDDERVPDREARAGQLGRASRAAPAGGPRPSPSSARASGSTIRASTPPSTTCVSAATTESSGTARGATSPRPHVASVNGWRGTKTRSRASG